MKGEDPFVLQALLGNMIGQLGQSLGRTETDADRQADLTLDLLTDSPGTLDGTRLGTGQIEETLIDGIDILHRTVGGEEAHDPRRHITVEGIVAGEGDDAVETGQGL